jgi:peptide/nickel transport system substrate-binding protein
VKRSLLVLVACCLLPLTGCANGGGQLLTAPAAGTNDINPKPRDQVRDGGDLRWPITALPDNYNKSHFLGSQVDTDKVTSPLMPSLFVGTANGELAPDPDYLVSAELTSPSPQVITYTLNPRATWSDGVPITWRDLEAQWKARNGSNPAFQVASRTGYEDIGSVTSGGDEKRVVVTFARPFAEWKSLFSLLYPASTNTDPTVFNTGWVNRIPTTAGPFALDSIDQTAKTVTLKRDPRWWGQPTKLDRIIFRVYERSAQADALANNEIDFYAIGSSVDMLKRAQAIPGVAVRQAPERLYDHLTFNGSPGAILSDVKLRQAIAKGIDRTAIAKRLVGQIVPNVSQLGSHIYSFGSKDYRDNSDTLRFDPAAANRQLDELGWVRPAPDATRAKEGKELRLRLLEGAPNPVREQIDRTVLDQLSRIGVHVAIETVPIGLVATQYKSGNFDLVSFGWQKSATPFMSSRAQYAVPNGNDVQQNYGRIYSPEITALFDQGLRELDDAKRAEIGNRIDQLAWQEVHHLPLYPGTGAYAVRSTLANFGAPGFADIDYVNMGYAK